MANPRRNPVVNRRHLARQEREQIQTRVIRIVTISILVFVVVVVAYGFVVGRLIEPNQPIAIVNGEEITTREYQARVRYERNLLVNQWINIVNTMQLFGDDPNTQAFFQNQLNQIQIQLDPTAIGRTVLNDMIADRLIRAEAAVRGITVTSAEIDQAVEEFFSYYDGGEAPTPTTVPTTEPTSTLTSLQMDLTAPTATPTLTATIALTETQPISGAPGTTATGPAITTTPVITVTPTVSAEVTATAVITITATPEPTKTPYTLDAFQENYREALQALGGRFGFSERDLRYLLESQIYHRKLLEVLTVDQARSQDQVWARHILVADEETALTVLARLEAGEDFAALAAELSSDTATGPLGGDLGWFGPGRMVEGFEKVAYNLAIGALSDPVQTQFGWHIIQVLGHELRPLSAQEYERARQVDFEEWVSRQRLDADVVLPDYWADRVPTDPALPNLPSQ